MNYLHRFLFFVFCFLLFAFFAFAQQRVVQNLPKYDHQTIHFGFTLGINNTDFKVKHAANFGILDTLYVVEPSSSSGFNLGIVSNLRIGEFFDLRFIPDLSFAQRDVLYTFVSNGAKTTVKKSVESTFLDFPFDIKYKSVRINNYRVYVLVGAKYCIDMASQANVANKKKELLKIKKYDYGYEYGVGMDFYLEYFKFSTELKMFHGFNDLLVNDNTIYSSSLDKLNSKIFLISFTFE